MATKTISAKAQLSRNSKLSMNSEAKGIFSALALFKKTAMKSKEMQDFAEELTGSRMAMQDLTLEDIWNAQTYPIYIGEVPTKFCARKGKNGFEVKRTWTLNDLHKAFERKYATKPFKREIIQQLEVMHQIIADVEKAKAEHEAKQAKQA